MLAPPSEMWPKRQLSLIFMEWYNAPAQHFLWIRTNLMATCAAIMQSPQCKPTINRQTVFRAILWVFLNWQQTLRSLSTSLHCGLQMHHVAVITTLMEPVDDLNWLRGLIFNVHRSRIVRENSYWLTWRRSTADWWLACAGEFIETRYVYKRIFDALAPAIRTPVHRVVGGRPNADFQSSSRHQRAPFFTEPDGIVLQLNASLRQT
jgi:hypothetical protein